MFLKHISVETDINSFPSRTFVVIGTLFFNRFKKKDGTLRVRSRGKTISFQNNERKFPHFLLSFPQRTSFLSQK